MPKITAYAPIFRDWEALLGAVLSNASLLPGTDPLKAELESVLAKTREMKVQQEDFLGKRRATTQALQQLVDEGQEVARKLRAQVVSALGSRTELLKQFGIATRKRKSTTKATEKLPVIETPKAAPPRESGTEAAGKGDPA
jgi:hypothetical protein